MKSTRIGQQGLLQLIIMCLLVLPVAGQTIGNQETGAYEWRSGEPIGVGSGLAVVFDVGDAPDSSVQADLKQLLPELWDLAPAMGAAGTLQEEIVVRYKGKGRVGQRLLSAAGVG